MSGEKIRLLKAYGAEIVITPTSVAPDSAESYNGVADRLTREIPGAWRPNQFSNLANPDVHYRITGPEIWDQTGGRITARSQGSALVARSQVPGSFSRSGIRPSKSSVPTLRARFFRAIRPNPGKSRVSAKTSFPRRLMVRSSTNGCA